MAICASVPLPIATVAEDSDRWNNSPAVGRFAQAGLFGELRLLPAVLAARPRRSLAAMATSAPYAAPAAPPPGRFHDHEGFTVRPDCRSFVIMTMRPGREAAGADVTGVAADPGSRRPGHDRGQFRGDAHRNCPRKWTSMVRSGRLEFLDRVDGPPGKSLVWGIWLPVT